MCSALRLIRTIIPASSVFWLLCLGLCSCEDKQRLQEQIAQATTKSATLKAELESVNKEWASVKEQLNQGNPPHGEGAQKLDEQVKQLQDDVTATQATVNGLKSDYETYSKQYLPEQAK